MIGCTDVYGVYGLRCLGNIKPNYLFIWSFKTIYVYLRKNSDHYSMSLLSKGRDLLSQVVGSDMHVGRWQS